MNTLAGRLAAIERELAIVSEVLASGPMANTLGEVRAAVAGRERGQALLKMGGRIRVEHLGDPRGSYYDIPAAEGVSAIVLRRVVGGVNPTDETEAHEFESVVDALDFLDTSRDARVTFVGASGGKDLDLDLSQVARIRFDPADRKVP